MVLNPEETGEEQFPRAESLWREKRQPALLRLRFVRE